MLSDFLQVKKKDAEKIKTKLIENNIYVFNLKPLHDDYFVYFPISNKKIAKKYGKIFRKSSKEYEKRTISLKDILTKMKLNLSQIKSITSYDTVGAIAILKITDDLIPYEKEIAESLLKTNPSLKTIVKKTKEHHGVYRVQSVKWLAGKRTFLTYVKEAGAIFKVKVGDMFFSPRLSFERLRIANLVKPHSNVAVFFSGVAPFSIVIAKKQPLIEKILSIELNPKAHDAAVENIKLNDVKDKIVPICADVTKYAKKIENWADYVIMPLPKTADIFLESAYKAIKKPKKGKSGLISLYKFVSKEDPYTEILKELKEFAKKKDCKLKVDYKRKVRDYSPKIMQIVIDFRFIY